MKDSRLVFVSHTPEYAELLRILTTPGGGGALVLGPFGIGKTALVRTVLDHPDVPRTLMRVHCSPTLAREPCGALSPYLGAGAATDNPAHVLRAIRHILDAGAVPGSVPIVAVEDAEFLDAETAFILATLVDNGAITLVATGHDSDESRLSELAGCSHLTTIVVQPLGLDGMRLIGDGLADGALTANAVAIIARMSGGNPAFVRAYVRACLDQGLVVSGPDRTDDGRRLLTLARPTPDPDDALIELVWDVTRSLSPAQVTVLEAVALAGPVGGDELSTFAKGEHRRLIESGILRADEEGTVRFAAEIFAIVLRTIIPPGRSAELYDAWRACADESRRGAPSRVQWALDIGADVPSSDVLNAMERATIDLDFALAWKLADALDDSHRADLLRARALLGLRRFYSARAMLLRMTGSTDDPDVLHRSRALLAVARDTISSLSADAEATAVLVGESDDVRDTLSPDRAEELLADPGLSPSRRLVALLALFDDHCAAGRTESALRHARSAQALIEADDRLVADYWLPTTFRIGWALVFSGRHREAETLLRDAERVPLRAAASRAGALGVIRGLSEFVKGQSALARASLNEAVAELRVHGLPQMLALALALRALVMSDSESGGVEDGGRQWRHARTALSGVTGDRLDLFPLIERELLASPSSPIFSDGPAGTQARERLAELSVLMEGSRAALLARFAHALAVDEPGAATALARDADEAGEWAISASALARAAQLSAASGDERGCGAALRDLRILLRERNMTPSALWSRALAMAELTRREEEIVHLTRAGKSNGEIARVLTVSQRTVEGHLYRIFAKLGITERSELSRDTGSARTLFG